MHHFHIIVAISNPLTQDPRGENSTGETSEQVDKVLGTEWQIPEDALLVYFVKRRKLKKKWLKFFWVIKFYNTMSFMVFFAF